MQVTADLHVYQAASLQVLFAVFSMSNIVKALFKSVSFWSTFALAWLITFALGKNFRPSMIKDVEQIILVANSHFSKSCSH